MTADTPVRAQCAGTRGLAEARPAAPVRAHDEPHLSPDQYKQVFRRHPAGVAVVTLADPRTGLPVGFTATSVISVSAAPPVLAFSIASTSSSWPALARAATVVVNFLGDGQADLSTRFATHGIDRFAGTEHIRLAGGEPVLTGSRTWVHGRVLERIAVGDSHLVTVQAITSDTSAEGGPLVYHDRAYTQLADHYEI
ncbi:flavin reductase family protein [Cellulomonas chengniuliangii]|uniref:Flavin reductase family protein n=1 Tax=Cellulomonas chengniuliangii TaxID=2968084 RepID=A0ABY5L5K7_9CELL|nr:flavin reductase family protein [Cellulomonas chengniuliangii]MCC2307333.1 flavin reductase family protein [Cellulomonas chengniuliangii]MCC2317771.1 flavin reductase family protein [Cellulomonas chengniuliangii]UUI75878.1 flavin reductase family protein [Cellulomonas chengniuliangii]